MRKEIFDFRISYVNYQISNRVSVYFAKSVRIKKKIKKMRKEIVEFRISYVNYQISNRLSVYFAKFCSHKKKKLKNAERNFRFSHILCELSN